MSDIVTFLLARIAEDEAAVAFDPDSEPWLLYRVGHSERCDYPGDVPGYCTCGAIARVLAECETKRWIVTAFVNYYGPYCGENPNDPKSLIGVMAEVYDKHPDYREEWRWE